MTATRTDPGTEDVAGDQASLVETAPPSQATVPGLERATRRPRWLDPDSPVPVYLGVAAIAVGGALIAYTWLRVARLTTVALQLPYLASSGFTGVGLVVVGALGISLAAKRRDAAERNRQLEELSAVLGAICAAVEARPRPRKRT
jgi:hypothetical protein